MLGAANKPLTRRRKAGAVGDGGGRMGEKQAATRLSLRRHGSEFRARRARSALLMDTKAGSKSCIFIGEPLRTFPDALQRSSARAVARFSRMRAMSFSTSGRMLRTTTATPSGVG